MMAGFFMGLVGSLHCAGMCGPLALALPAAGGGRAAFLAGRLLYNLGRTLTYALLGALFGAIGRSVSLAGWQRGLSIATGVVILALVLLGPRAHRLAAAAGLQRGLALLQRTLGDFLRRRGPLALLATGILNGLLPCGLVYVALAAAAATGSVAGGMGFMALFGLGTTPMLLAIALAGGRLQGAVRQRFQRAIPAALCLLAVLFILRGLSLGIPYLSPDMDKATSTKPACCH